jgi:hypothetical protein
MTRQHITLSLLLMISGTLLTVGVALSRSLTSPQTVPFTALSADNTTCADCHTEPHNGWHVVTHGIQLTSTAATVQDADDCVTCHMITPDLPMPSNLTVNARMVALRHQLAVYTMNQATDTVSPTVQQVEAILALVEADNGWGFHSTDYVNSLLTDAESLVSTLHLATP